MSWFTTLPILSPAVLAPVYSAAAVGVAVLATRPARRLRRRWWTAVPVVAAAGAAIGGVVSWYVGDVQNAFGVPPTWVDRIWVSALGAGVGLVALNLALAPWWRKAVAVVAVAVFASAAFLAINRDGGEFQNINQVLGHDTVAPLDASAVPPSPSGTSTEFDSSLYATWKAPADMPAKGSYGSVTIPGTVSGFPARQAIVYLPPAALVADAPALPVLMMLSGQPASPASVVGPGHLVETLDAFAAKNHGLAPIVVIPDQLAQPQNNPMCVDGPLGNSATYLTVDVIRYMTEHYHVASGPSAWGVGGFSQGGTCAIQLAAGRPDLFGSFIDVSGELGPSLGSRATTIAKGFKGDEAAYEAAQPQALLAAHTPYAATTGFFAVGQNDAKYSKNMTANSEAARRAGIAVTTYVSPGTAHDWTTATNGFAHGIGVLYPVLGLSAQVQTP
ncbi:alpha/beta hydrolase [Frigoribacterium sp. 2-23]|uniref:alpha/beta hydrolase n=1 Tax=Frigoribacterium sp. 2-23 TaxID=3415006 RepID=UPI003C6FFF07